MLSNWKQTLLGYAQRQHLRGLALAVFWVALGVLLWWSIWLKANTPVAPAPDDVLPPQEVAEAISGPIASTSEPLALRIPALNIAAQFEMPLGLEEDGSIEVPEAFDTVGWYEHSPTPGELGPSVILGHVDSYEGPAVFFYLGQLEEGDTIEIDRADGSTAVFSVIGYERVEQNAFPTERVYGDLSYAGIRLITCSGTYDRQTLRYDRNLIVYGRLSEVRYPEIIAE